MLSWDPREESFSRQHQVSNDTDSIKYIAFVKATGSSY